MSNNSQLSARQRIASLLDDSSFVEVGAYVTARSTDFNLADKETPSDGVITGYGVIDGNLVFVYSQDAAVLNGSIGEMHAGKIAKMYDMAVKMGAPVIGLIDCAGLRMQEAVDALNGFGTIYAKQAMASGVIPQITAVFGSCGGGAAIIPGLSDFAYMTREDAKLFVNAPNVLDGNHVSKLDTASAEYQSVNSGNIDGVFDTDAEVLGQIRQLVTILPANNETDLSYSDCTDDLNRAVAVEGYVKDAKSLLITISDNNLFVETKQDYAKDMVTGFIRFNGATVGCVANQGTEGGEVLSTRGAYKAAEFVSFCDAFEIPVLTVTNVKGYKATVEEEAGIAKAVAAMTAAFASASVPKVNLITGEAFGSAYTAMNSKAIGADIEYAWQNAKLGVMDPETAVNIMYAEEIAASEDKKAMLADKKRSFAEQQASAMAAARRGIVDDIIVPDATRKRLIAAFEMLYTKCEDKPAKKHGAK
ncbi:MAG: methylmalonyl-CoA carboxyltransferase [Bacteroides sp.]|nr:methylmalonyl-CoA carboxyltransferase [Bacteroides sp.]MCM1550608.1 carboxyl transferase [Clostridium sp.]